MSGCCVPAKGTTDTTGAVGGSAPGLVFPEKDLIVTRPRDGRFWKDPARGSEQTEVGRISRAGRGNEVRGKVRGESERGRLAKAHGSVRASSLVATASQHSFGEWLLAAGAAPEDVLARSIRMNRLDSERYRDRKSGTAPSHREQRAALTEPAARISARCQVGHPRPTIQNHQSPRCRGPLIEMVEFRHLGAAR